MIHGAIFDLDDTLAESKKGQYMAWDAALAPFGYKYSDIPENIRGSFIGMRIIDMAQGVVDNLNLDVSSEFLYQTRMQHFISMIEQEVQLMPGVIHALSLCKSLKLKCALSSSGVKEYIDLFLKKYSLNQYFEAVISGDDVEKGKPDPESYILACKKINLNPQQCVVFEDSHHGVISAKKAGCKCIAIPYPGAPAQDLTQADIIIPSLKKLTAKTIQTL